MRTAIKIYGERNSGTNYLEQLIEKNLEAEVLKFRIGPFSRLLLTNIKYDLVQDILFYFDRKKSLGWKHGCPRVKAINAYHKSPLLVITITKNPYAYLLSLHRNPYHFKGTVQPDFEGFLKQRWQLRGRDFANAAFLESPVELWNIKNKAYWMLQEDISAPVINLRYESLVRDPEGSVQRIAEMGKISWKGNRCFQNVLYSTKQNYLTFEDYLLYSTNKKWMEEISARAIKQINEKLDKPVVSYYQYEMIPDSK